MYDAFVFQVSTNGEFQVLGILRCLKMFLSLLNAGPLACNKCVWTLPCTTATLRMLLRGSGWVTSQRSFFKLRESCTQYAVFNAKRCDRK